MKHGEVLSSWPTTVAEALQMCRVYIDGKRGPLTVDEVAHLANVLVDATDEPPDTKGVS